MKATVPKIETYLGIKNPSGAVALNNRLFVVADDEDNQLRIYDRTILEKPLQTLSLSAVFKGVIQDGDGQEIDLESAAAIGDIVFWLGSHSTNRDGEARPARQRLFAVKITPGAKDKFNITPVGDMYTRLIDDLREDKRFEGYHFGKAHRTQPKAIGGLSIEGLASTADNGLLIGFRNPLAGGDIKNDRLKHGKALVIKLKNPFEVIHGLKAKLGDPIELSLDGFGIREITRFKKHKYLIVAGPYHDNMATNDHKIETSKLYSWSVKTGKVNEIKHVDLSGLNIEAALFYPDNNDTVQLLSDDGKVAGAQGFRSVTVAL